ncbi:MAG: response regulator, partial [Nitrospinae bacterium]|nr:response regulator [Nitrospinota bacterium]
LKINPMWEATLGYAEREILSTPFLDFIHPDDRDATMKEVERQIGGEATIRFINRYRCKDGDYKWLEWMATPSVDKRLLFAAARDVTERRQAEINLLAAKEQAEAATKLKDKFVSLVAHDLRSPFASIIGLLKLFAERKSHPEDEMGQKIFERIFASGERMMMMIEDLLKINRLHTGQITPQPKFFKGHIAVAVTIGSLSHNAAQKGILIINEVPVDMRIYADPPLFDEILLNLLSNAIKFCSKGDKITVFVPPGLKSAIAVRDTGKGMDEKTMSNLFKEDMRTTTPGTAGELGTGLGLAFCHDIVKAHGGELAVTSELGKGTEFFVTFPYVRPLALVVDDDPMALLIVRRHLEKIGIDVVEALDGERALAAVKHKPPHIVIADITMPGMDGFALLGHLRHDNATRAIPVIVMTSADGDAREKAFRQGANDFVSKPIDVEDFIPRVRRFVG